MPAVLLLAIASGPLFLRPQEASSPVAAASRGFQVTPEDIGDSLLYHRRYQEAIEQYSRASKTSPDVWNKMGIAYQMLSDLKDAARCYRESLRLRPSHAFTLNNLGTVYDMQGDYARAEGYYRKALKVAPASPRIAMNLATNLMIQNKFSQGSELYKRALALDPHAFEEFVGPVAPSGVPLRQRGAMNYYKARECAQAGMNDRAVTYLGKALSEGFTDRSHIAQDSSFNSLRGNAAFQQLIAEHAQ